MDVSLGRPVERIHWDDTGVVVANSAGKRVESDRVVITISLGVLKSDSVTFDPPLPKGHAAAIDSLGMGPLDKVRLRFDASFWNDDHLMWTRIAPEGSPFVQWFNMAPLTGAPVLMSLIGGTLAQDWSSSADDEVQAAAVASLQDFFDAQR